MYARIPYLDDLAPDHIAVEGELNAPAPGSVDPWTFTLSTYAGVLDLAPGDTMLVTDLSADGLPTLTALAVQRDCWLIELHGRTPNLIGGYGPDGIEVDIEALDDWNWEAAKLSFDEVATAVADVAEIDRGTNYTLTVATDDRTLLWSVLTSHASALASYAVRREPGQQIDLTTQRQQRGLLDYPTFAVLT